MNEAWGLIGGSRSLRRGACAGYPVSNSRGLSACCLLRGEQLSSTTPFFQEPDLISPRQWSWKTKTETRANLELSSLENSSQVFIQHSPNQNLTGFLNEDKIQSESVEQSIYSLKLPRQVCRSAICITDIPNFNAYINPQ